MYGYFKSWNVLILNIPDKLAEILRRTLFHQIYVGGYTSSRQIRLDSVRELLKHHQFDLHVFYHLLGYRITGRPLEIL